MGFYLRKSIGLGPMRVSVSTRGLGASIGMPGLRVGAGPRGAYVSLAGGVVSYRATTRMRAGRGRPAPSTRPAPATPPPGFPAPSDVVLSDVSGATTLDMARTDASDLVRQLNAAASSPPFWPWVLLAAIVVGALVPVLFVLGLPLTAWVAWQDVVRRRVVAFYDVRDGEAQRYQALVDAFGTVQAAQRAWHVVASGALSTTYQNKVHAGASSLVSRLPLVRSVDGPRHLRTNIAVPSLSTPRRSLHFLPDRMLVRDGKHYADVSYADLASRATRERFIEDGPVPSDSLVLDQTWQYVNKSGGPDRRFKSNRRLPVLEYGRLRLDGTNGYRAVLDFSTPRASAALSVGLQTMVSPVRSVPAPRPAESRPAAPAVPAGHGTPPAARPVDAPRPTVGEPAAPAAVRTGGNGGNGENGGRHRRPDAAVDLDAPADPPGPVDAPASDRLRRRRLSADGRVAVVGESRYQDTLARAAVGTVGHGSDDHRRVTAMLVPEPENPFDEHAVRVDVVIDGTAGPAGHLAGDVAASYQPTLLRLRERGFLGTCPGRITGGGPSRTHGLYLHLGAPRSLVFENLEDDIELAAPERMVTVTREEDHQEVLARFDPSGRDATRVAATLRSTTVGKGRYRGAYGIEVLLDGRRVGELTAAMSSRYRDLVVEAEEHGGRPACEALVTYGHRGYQVDLRLPQVS